MIRWILAVLLIIVILSGIPGIDGMALGANTCVDCHRGAAAKGSQEAWYRNQFIHWYGSVHGRKGVTCEECHGGDPSGKDKNIAHRGLKSSGDPVSPVYYKNLPETCGRCHTGVYQRFVQSRHFKNLKTDRLAPTCTTCHGLEMDIGAVRPLQLAGACIICHNQQGGVRHEVAELARQGLEGIARAEQALQKAQTLVDLAREEGIEPKKAEELLGMARGRLQKSGELWHTFQLEVFRQELAEIEKLAGNAYTAARDAVLKKEQ